MRHAFTSQSTITVVLAVTMLLCVVTAAQAQQKGTDDEYWAKIHAQAEEVRREEKKHPTPKATIAETNAAYRATVRYLKDDFWMQGKTGMLPETEVTCAPLAKTTVVRRGTTNTFAVQTYVDLKPINAPTGVKVRKRFTCQVGPGSAVKCIVMPDLPPSFYEK
jgi:hypothetical protein